jgi:hypothetical protein
VEERTRDKFDMSRQIKVKSREETSWRERREKREK